MHFLERCIKIYVVCVKTLKYLLKVWLTSQMFFLEALDSFSGTNSKLFKWLPLFIEFWLAKVTSFVDIYSLQFQWLFVNWLVDRNSNLKSLSQSAPSLLWTYIFAKLNHSNISPEIIHIIYPETVNYFHTKNEVLSSRFGNILPKPKKNLYF